MASTFAPSGQPSAIAQTASAGRRPPETLLQGRAEPHSGFHFSTTTSNTRPRPGLGSLLKSTTPATATTPTPTPTPPSLNLFGGMQGLGQAKQGQKQGAKDLKATQHELFNKEKYSDLTVKCKSREWKCHRAILCPRCPFFEAACGGNFTEASSREIDLSDDDETALGIMLQYLYTYEIFNHGLATATSFQLLVVGDKYELEEIRSVGLENLTTEIANLTSSDGSWVAEWYPQIGQLQQTGTQVLKVLLSNAIAMHAREMIRHDGIRDLIASDGALAVQLVEKLASPATAMFGPAREVSSTGVFPFPEGRFSLGGGATRTGTPATFGSTFSPTTAF